VAFFQSNNIRDKRGKAMPKFLAKHWSYFLLIIGVVALCSVFFAISNILSARAAFLGDWEVFTTPSWDIITYRMVLTALFHTTSVCVGLYVLARYLGRRFDNKLKATMAALAIVLSYMQYSVRPPFVAVYSAPAVEAVLNDIAFVMWRLPQWMSGVALLMLLFLAIRFFERKFKRATIS